MIDIVDPNKRPVHWYMDIDMPVDVLWALFSDYRGIANWWPNPDTRFNFIGDGIGMIRNIYTDDGQFISQRLEAMDETRRTIESTFLNCEDFGMKSFYGTMRATSLENGWSRLTYMAIGEALDPSEHEEHVNAVEAYLDGFYGEFKAQLIARGIASGDSVSVEA